MANNENLKKGKATRFTSGEQAAKAGRKGGIASSKAKKARRDIKAAMETLLEASVNNPQIANSVAQMFGVKPETVTWLDSCVAGTVREAVKGNVKAMHEIRDIMGCTSNEESAVVIEIAPRGSRNED